MNEFKLASSKEKADNVSAIDNFQSGFDKVFGAVATSDKNNASATNASEIRTDNQIVQKNPSIEEAVKPTISEIDLINSQKKGYEEGYAKGYAAAKSASEELEKQLSQTIANIDSCLKEVLQARKFDDLKKSEDVIELALKVARKMSGKSLSENACQVVENVIIRSFEILFDEPKIVISVNSKILDGINKRVQNLVKSEGFNYQVEIVANDKIAIGACQIQWQGGGLVTDYEAVWKDIEAMI
jgi:flagellar biosynthesis/type III secretory pathway protein FliH